MGRTTVYFAREGKLVPVEKERGPGAGGQPPGAAGGADRRPRSREQAEGLEATLPSLVGDEDILGISLEADVLLVNLSESFRAEIQSWGSEKETLLCYSMVNTLCENTGAREVYFFFEGEQVEYIAGVIYWAGTSR